MYQLSFQLKNNLKLSLGWHEKGIEGWNFSSVLLFFLCFWGGYKVCLETSKTFQDLNLFIWLIYFCDLFILLQKSSSFGHIWSKNLDFHRNICVFFLRKLRNFYYYFLAGHFSLFFFNSRFISSEFWSWSRFFFILIHHFYKNNNRLKFYCWSECVWEIIILPL